MLLKMCSIQLYSYGKSINTKMKEMCKFINTELNFLGVPELILAKRYFEKGQQYGFFKRVQKGRDNITEIKNMAWDLLHLRTLEEESECKIQSQADVFIPYLFTFDKGLNHIRECYDLSALAVNYVTQERISIYTYENEINEYMKEYCHVPDYEKRQMRRAQMDIKELIGCLEKEVQKEK